MHEISQGGTIPVLERACQGGKHHGDTSEVEDGQEHGGRGGRHLQQRVGGGNKAKVNAMPAR